MMRWIEANGTVLRYELAGAGATVAATPLVLVHEMGGMLETWDAVVPALSRDRPVLRYDMRGAGLSEKKPGPLSIDALADDLVALADRVGLSGKVVVVGNAVGAAVTIRTVARHPEQIAALIAMAPSTYMQSERRAGALSYADQLEEYGLRGAVDSERLPSATAPPDDPVDILRCRRLANDPHGLAGLWRMLAGLDLSADLARISCPTLVLAGSRDEWRPPAIVETVARAIPGAQFRTIDTGHVMAVETPDLTIATIRDYLAEIGL
jgi:3-oxoadipate enol-lactonase